MRSQNAMLLLLLFPLPVLLLSPPRGVNQYHTYSIGKYFYTYIHGTAGCLCERKVKQLVYFLPKLGGGRKEKQEE